MLSQTNYTVDLSILKEAVDSIADQEFKITINQPTGDFFYDPWEIKPELKNTVWQKILDSLPFDQGEARIITLKPGTAYCCHADADDRWHLNLQSKEGYICDIDNLKMYLLSTDGIWYTMNAGRLHTAANFGSIDRIQLVVRQLLKKNMLSDPVYIKISSKSLSYNFRYQFDNTVSPWLNYANKHGIINNFKFVKDEVLFNIERNAIDSLNKILPDIFEITV